MRNFLENFSHFLILLCALAMRIAAARFESADYVTFLSRWFQHFRELGFAGLANPPGDYNVPYLYLLLVGSYLPASIPGLFVIKSISIFFDFALAGVSSLLVFQITNCKKIAKLAFSGIILMPTVILNSSFWGQCDSVYSFFSILLIYFAISRYLGSMFVAFGTAISFKLQAIFIAPFLVWFSSRDFNWRQAGTSLLVPVTFVIWLIPSLFAGADFGSLIWKYPSQTRSYPALSMNAPNLYLLIESKYSWVFLPLGILFTIGLILFLWQYLVCRGINWSQQLLLKSALLSVLVCAYFLPKMHDRYFYMAGVLAFLSALVDPKLVIAFLLIEASSLEVYFRWLFGISVLPNSILAILNLVALVILFFNLLSTRVGESDTQLIPSCKMLKITALFAPVVAMVVFLWFSSVLWGFSDDRDYKVGIGIVRPTSPGDISFVAASKYSQSYGAPLPNRNIDSPYLDRNGVKVKYGIGVHADSNIQFNLETKCYRFKASICTPEYLKVKAGSVRAEIWSNGYPVWESKVLQGPSSCEEIDLEREFAGVLTLNVSSTGDGINSDHAAWLNPTLYCS